MAFRKAADLSLGSVFADAIDVYALHPDGFEGLQEREAIEVHVPSPDKSDRENYGFPKTGDGWEDHDNAYEYRDQYWPMMNSLWPVSLAYGENAEDVARALQKLSVAVSLVSINETRDNEGAMYLAMTGGGMDLSDHLAKAYLACGCVPPIRLLERIGESHQRFEPGVARLMRGAMRKAATHMCIIAARLTKRVGSVQASR